MASCKHRILDNCKKDGKPCIFSEECFEPKAQKPTTNGDRIRAMSDETLCEKLYDIWLGEIQRGVDLATNWCNDDCCFSEDCGPEKHKACILRWLQSPPKEA